MAWGTGYVGKFLDCRMKSVTKAPSQQGCHQQPPNQEMSVHPMCAADSSFSYINILQSHTIITATDAISPSLKYDCKVFWFEYEVERNLLSTWRDKVKTVLFQVAGCADETKLCPCLDMPSAPKTSPEPMLPSYFYFKRLHWGTDPKPTEASSLFTNMLQWHSGSGPNTILMLKNRSK